MNSIKLQALLAGVAAGALATAIGGVAAAQVPQSATGASSSDSDQVETVVVTGTLIRGIAPVGTNVITMSSAQVEASGATTTAQILQDIPQLGVFNNLQQPANAFNDVTTNRPNLRNLPGFNTSGSSSTLVLIDGQRVVGAGIASTSPDPDIIPPALIERVDVVPDGGSAIYGSDAVAGTINFITRKDFDGIEADAHYGFNTGYRYGTYDGNITGGHNWSNGSAFISYDYVHNDVATASDLGYVKVPLQSYSGLTSPARYLDCSPGNVSLTAGVAFGPGGLIMEPATFAALPYTTGTAVPNTVNSCDPTGGLGVYPAQDRYSIFAGVTQQLMSGVTFDMRGYYMNRRTTLPLGDFAQQGQGSVLIGPAPFGTASPYEASHIFYPADVIELQNVYYDLPDSFQTQHLSLSTWGLMPSITADLGGGWELRANLNYGESTTQNDVGQGDSTAVGNAITAGLLNPYDPDTSNPAAIAAINNYETYGLTHQSQLDTKVVADGSLFTLPGGEVKAAAGAEYTHETFNSQTGTIIPGTQNTGSAGVSVGGTVLVAPYAALPHVVLSRDVTSVFGEVDVPIIGDGNNFMLMDALTISASARYDDYSDFGGTTNPKLGVTYKPIDWVKVRWSWGKSFVAPSLADNSTVSLTSANIAPTSIPFLLPPASLIASGKYPAPTAGQSNVIVILGTHPGIKPETAQTWSLGADVDPPFVPGLHAGLTYWHLSFDGVIAIPDFTNQVNFWTNFGPLITVNPTAAQVAAAEAAPNVVVGTGSASSIYAILDARKNNTGNYLLDGLDFNLSYAHDVPWGSVDFNADADYELKRQQSPFAGSALLNVPNVTNLRARASVGTNFGNLRAQATLNHTSGYNLNAPVGVAPVQTSVASFDTVDLFFRYDLDGAGFFQNAALTLNVDNVFDANPPEYQGVALGVSADGFTNGATLGRVILFGINKKF